MSANDEHPLPGIDWAARFNDLANAADKFPAGSEESRKMWDEKAPSFARKPSRSGYIGQLVSLLGCKPGETVLDAGCGSGTLAVPLAKAGCRVSAVDFSSAMLDELRKAAEAEGVPVAAEGAASDGKVGIGRIETFERSWQQSWDGLPAADTAVASRSLITADIADAVDKLESHARRRVAITLGAGDLPYRDRRILEALGRSDAAEQRPWQLQALLNFLLEKGRLPRLSYIVVESPWQRETRAELEAAVRRGHEPRNVAEEETLAAFLDKHIVRNEEKGCFELDYPRTNRWAYLEWDV